MTAGRIFFPGKMPIENSNGDRIAGAKAYFYANGTTTLANTYTTSGLAVANTNPVLADDVGVWPAMWADTATLFTVALTDSAGVPIPSGTWSGLSAAIDATIASVNLAEIAQQAAELAEENAEQAQLQAQAAAATVTGAPFSATSITSLSIGTGLKAPTLTQTGKLFTAGQSVVIARTSAPSNQMIGVVQSVAGQLVTVDVALATAPGGAGPYADWTMSLASANGVLSVVGLSGVILAPALKAALAITTADITNFNAATDARAIAFAVAL